jgi:hypothetical protein
MIKKPQKAFKDNVKEEEKIFKVGTGTGSRIL